MSPIDWCKHNLPREECEACTPPSEQEDLFGAPYQRHSPTSKAAATDIAGKAGTLRRAVYDFIVRKRDYGATDPEAQAALLLDGSTQRPRRVRLVELGLVEDSGRTRPSHSGKQCVVWVAT